MALNKGVWDPKLRGTNIKGTNLKSLKEVGVFRLEALLRLVQKKLLKFL